MNYGVLGKVMLIDQQNNQQNITNQMKTRKEKALKIIVINTLQENCLATTI